MKEINKIELLKLIGNKKGLKVLDHIHLDNGKIVTVYEIDGVKFGVRI